MQKSIENLSSWTVWSKLQFIIQERQKVKRTCRYDHITMQVWRVSEVGMNVKEMSEWGREGTKLKKRFYAYRKFPNTHFKISRNIKLEIFHYFHDNFKIMKGIYILI